MAKVQDVADFFIQLTNEDKEANDMTNMRLNRLLYLAQGHYLALHNEPLFEVDFQLCEIGPVVPCIYDKYQPLGNSPIKTYEDMDMKRPFTTKEQNLLFDVLTNYSGYSTAKLADLGHEQGRSCDSNSENGINFIPTSKVEIKELFKNVKLRTYAENLKAIPIVDGHHLPVEWDTEEDDEAWGCGIAQIN